MANYFEMSKDQLRAEKAALEQSYAEFKAKGLKLNMARGKPGPHQMDLAMDLLKMSDYTTENGYDARNYGNLEGLEEARLHRLISAYRTGLIKEQPTKDTIW